MIEGKTPEITLEQARTLLTSIRVAKLVDDGQGGQIETPLLVGLRDRAILATLKFTACRAGAVAKLRLGDFQHDGDQYVLHFRKRAARAGKSRCGTIWKRISGPISMRRGSRRKRKTGRYSVLRCGRTRQLTGNPMTSKSHLRAGQAAAKGRRAAGAVVAA